MKPKNVFILLAVAVLLYGFRLLVAAILLYGLTR